MRTMAFALACAALGCGSGGGGGGGDDAPPTDGGDGDGSFDGPPAGTPLAQRLTVKTVTAPAGVMGGDLNWRIWGRETLRTAPVFTVPYGDCGTLIGYTTGASPGTARVARLDASDQLVTTYDLGAYELRGLAAEPDGHWAALLWDQSTSPKQLRVTRFDAAGMNPRTTLLLDGMAAPLDFSIGESRLEYGNGKYGAYYHVTGIAGSVLNHEGDQLQWVDAMTGMRMNGWSWGCSHSMSELLRYEPTSQRFVAACVTDCYPGTASSNFATDAIGGIYLDNSRKVIDQNGACNGRVAAELGSMAPGASGYKLVFNGHQNTATKGQSSYDPMTMNQDIGWAAVDTAGNPSGGVTWLTTTPGNEANSSIAAWHPDGDTQEQYLVGWSEPLANGRAYKLGRYNASGAVIEAPVDITAMAQWGERDDPFRTHKNHDVVWAWFDAPGSTMLKIARVSSGQTAQCSTF